MDININQINNIKLGIIIDPLEKINYATDTSLAILFAAQRRGWQLWYIAQQDLLIKQGIVYAKMQELTVIENKNNWYTLEQEQCLELSKLDIILMRKDPPVDAAYLYITWLLDLVKQTGTLVINDPQALRDHNEKLFITYFPQCCPPYIVTSDVAIILEFLQQQEQIIIKDLESFAGKKVYYLKNNTNNNLALINTVTQNSTRSVMVQRYLSEIMETGDKRILLINGEPFPYALARLPAKGDFRGNLAAGATGKVVELTARDRWLCAEIAPTLKDKKLFFVGLDVIGEYITEINLTSPTGVRNITTSDASEKFVDLLQEYYFLHKTNFAKKSVIS